MSEGEYYVRQVEFPNRVARACVMPNDDGSFDIFLNTRWPDEVLAEALEHELRHIRGGHFYREAEAALDEAEAEGRPAPCEPLPPRVAAEASERRQVPLFGSRGELMDWLRTL